MSSLNSQESSNDIGKLTDKQQAEYRTAYQEYIAQMSQLEMGGGGGGERPVQPQPGQFLTACEDKSKDGGEQDGRKPFSKRSGGKLAPDSADFGDGLDPITEEDEKGEHGPARTARARRTSAERGGLFQGAAELRLKAGGGGLRYQKLTSDEQEWEEPDSKAEARAPVGGAKDVLSESMLDKKESSDSGVRSSESSPNHSLQDEEAELSHLAEVVGGARGPQEPAVVRMSICSEDQCSLLASSPEDSWPPSRTYNLNHAPSNVTLNNNANAQPAPSAGDLIVSSTPSSCTRPGPNNENVRVVHLKRAVTPGDPPEICTMSCDTVTFGEERESIL